MTQNTDLVFLPGYNQNLPKRHRELLKSAALSHAGSAAHKRRRRQRLGESTAKDEPSTSRRLKRRSSAELAAELDQRSTLRLWHGNSDPFDVAGVLYLSPRVAEILVFVRTHYLPAPFAAPPHMRAASITPWVEDHVKAGFQNILASLQEPSCAEAYIYSASVGMALVMSTSADFVREKLRMKSQALDALRIQVEDSADDGTTILRSSEYLFSAAVMDRAPAEAKVHGAVVRDLLYARALRDGFSSINSSFLMRILFKDAMLSEYSNTTTIFDPHVWEPVVAASIAPTEGMLPELVPPMDEPFDDFLARGDWIAVFTDARRALWAYRRPWVIYAGYAGQYWAYSRLVLLQCKSINRYVELRQQTAESPKVPETDAIQAKEEGTELDSQVEACVALTVLLFASLFRCKLDQLFYYNTKQLFNQLRSVIETTLTALNEEKESYRTVASDHKGMSKPLHNALLWSLFIGAVVEIQSRSIAGKAAYMTAEFHKHINRMGLASWPAVEQILSKFVYSPALLHPHDEERAELLGPFKEAFEDREVNTPLDDALEQPWMCHEANFTAYMNRTESLRGSVLRSSTDKR